MRLKVSLLALGYLLLFACIAQADQPGNTVQTAEVLARQYYLSGEQAYALGDLLTAVVEWETTLTLKPSSVYTRKRLDEVRARLDTKLKKAHTEYLASMVSWEQGNVDQAVVMMTSAKRLAPGALCVEKCLAAMQKTLAAREEKARKSDGPKMQVRAIPESGSQPASTEPPSRAIASSKETGVTSSAGDSVASNGPGLEVLSLVVDVSRGDSRRRDWQERLIGQVMGEPAHAARILPRDYTVWLTWYLTVCLANKSKKPTGELSAWLVFEKDAKSTTVLPELPLRPYLELKSIVRAGYVVPVPVDMPAAMTSILAEDTKTLRFYASDYYGPEVENLRAAIAKRIPTHLRFRAGDKELTVSLSTVP